MDESIRYFTVTAYALSIIDSAFILLAILNIKNKINLSSELFVGVFLILGPILIFIYYSISAFSVNILLYFGTFMQILILILDAFLLTLFLLYWFLISNTAPLRHKKIEIHNSKEKNYLTAKIILNYSVLCGILYQSAAIIFYIIAVYRFFQSGGYTAALLTPILLGCVFLVNIILAPLIIPFGFAQSANFIIILIIIICCWLVQTVFMINGIYRFYKTNYDKDKSLVCIISLILTFIPIINILVMIKLKKQLANSMGKDPV